MSRHLVGTARSFAGAAPESFPKMHFTDTDIEAALSRSARAMRKKVRSTETVSDKSDSRLKYATTTVNLYTGSTVVQ